MNGREAASTFIRAMLAVAACVSAPIGAHAQVRYTSVALPALERASPFAAALPTRTVGGGSSFAEMQLRNPRVEEARRDTDAELRRLFHSRGIPYPAAEVFLRAFKHERVLELWARHPVSRRFVLVEEYPICALSGELGPKSRQGDEQIPEGFYSIQTFNPWSEYHLSLGLDYPNRADRLRTKARAPLGGDIFIHGDCRTVGCLPLTDARIEEIYWIAVQARAAGQTEIPVHIFPARMDDAGMQLLKVAAGKDRRLLAFWQNLKAGYDYFEQARDVPSIDIDGRGAYVMPRYAGAPVRVFENAALYAF